MSNMKTETVKNLDALIAHAAESSNTKAITLYLGHRVVDRIIADQRRYTTLIHTIGIEEKPTILGCQFVIDRKAHPEYYGLREWK